MLAAEVYRAYAEGRAAVGQGKLSTEKPYNI